ncbi:putative SKP1/BTB/POZ domain, NPH3 domain-containing protein [Rosa chinensis]|uniref:Putative SKP1/BTB/POZ domain, NPH3 domain-containing protein n=2 Tax=Rosa chinensis TaxID=74649 RepID=A0A2P6SJE5_ROSCH|nr:BTB/POZ domain-containing protein At5g03250 isoform X1 [Rosa chinensis]PRQ58796.1 putative SKP1/BTB/POZ domain, NPH3 domain-containing protein [Rosa chinensis]
MACLKLGSKSEIFYLDGQTWLCSTGLSSDVIVEVEETSFHLHKFPLLSRSGLLEDIIAEFPSEDEYKCSLQLHDIPGGAKAFLLVAKFCYGVRFELNALNVVIVRCAAEYLRMNEDYGEGNLIRQAEDFLNDILGNWTDTIKVLETCEEVLPHAEELHIVSRCINSLAMTASADPSLFSWPMSGKGAVKSSEGVAFWNGISTTAKPHPVNEDWWFEEVSFLKLPFYKRLIRAVESGGMNLEKVAGSIMHYAKKHLSLLGRQSSFLNGNRAAPASTVSAPSDVDQRNLLEEIVELLPDQKGVTPTNFLLRLLRTSMILHASPSCRENLEKRVGAQLEQAALEDLLIPNMGYTVETLYDIDCVQRILDHFMLMDRDSIDYSSNCIVDEGQLSDGSHALTRMTMVAHLVDGYLAEVAPDVNLKLQKFQSLAALIPEYARPLDDGFYRAIDIYLKAHPWLTDSEKEQICRLMNCQKLSLEASTHAAQNERLPLRVIVQVLFFEQLRLRTSVAGWFFVSDNLENSQNLSGNLALVRNEAPAQAGTRRLDRVVAVDDMKERVSELEKECLSMKQEIEKLVKTKGSWNSLLKKFGLRLKSKPDAKKPSKPSCNGSEELPTSIGPLMDGKENYENKELRD